MNRKEVSAINTTNKAVSLREKIQIGVLSKILERKEIKVAKVNSGENLKMTTKVMCGM